VNYDTIAYISIQNKGWGCALCPHGSYSYFKKPDSDENYITNEDLKKDGFMMFIQC
jgi:hypothetical protein